MSSVILWMLVGVGMLALSWLFVTFLFAIMFANIAGIYAGEIEGARAIDAAKREATGGVNE